jgi:hypothetical protein
VIGSWRCAEKGLKSRCISRTGFQRSKGSARAMGDGRSCDDVQAHDAVRSEYNRMERDWEDVYLESAMTISKRGEQIWVLRASPESLGETDANTHESTKCRKYTTAINGWSGMNVGSMGHFKR